MSGRRETWLAALGKRDRITYAGTTAAMVMLALRGPDFARDSASYLEASSLRSALYPLFLRLTNPAESQGLYHLSITVQLLLGAVAVAATALTLSRLLSLGRMTFLVTWAGLMFPYIGVQQVGNAILSESLAYPFFLLGSKYLLEALLDQSDRAFFLQLLFYGLALLTRTQFAFVFPVAVLAAVYLGWKTRSTRRALVLSIASLATLLGATLLDRSYHLVRHGSFSGPSISGLVFATPALYLSTEADLDRLDEPQRSLLRKVRQDCGRKGLLSSDNDSRGGVTSYSAHYASAYNEIAWRSLYPALVEEFGTQGALSDRDWYQASDSLSVAAASILTNHPRGFARLYVSSILDRLGMSYAVFLTCLLALSVFASLRRPSAPALILAAVVLLHLANLSTVAVVQPVRLRYAFYTETLATVILIATMAAALLPPTNAPLSKPRS